jgi:hypothetical protein
MRMKISTILDHIDSGHMALPVFQRGYVWNRDQVRGLMSSLYRRHPVGSLLVWATESDGARHRGEGALAAGIVKLLLDGQQRMTSLYGIIRGAPPKFFDGNTQAFTGIRFHLERQEFAFYSPVEMRDDPLWIDVSQLMLAGNDGLGRLLAGFGSKTELLPNVGTYAGRLSQILGIRDIELHVEEVTGADKTIDVVVDIFNRVNSGGTKLSSGDLALAKICADWPDARDRMKRSLKRWEESGYKFNLDWMLRCVNTVVTGEAKFAHLHSVDATQVKEGVERAEKAIDKVLNKIADRLGLDHDRVFFGRFALPVMVNYLDRRGGHLGSAAEWDKLLYWYLQAAMWGRFSGSTESYIDQDLKAVEGLDGGLDRLIQQVRLWHGGLQVVPGHFAGWSLGARFYPVLYMLTRVGKARDWGEDVTLKRDLLGKMSQLEVHHIFPKAQLYKAKYHRSEINAVANFCFLTKETNLLIGDTEPERYFPEVEAKLPGALASQWVPMDSRLWNMDRYRDFLVERQRLLADATNDLLAELLHGEKIAEETAQEPAVAPAIVVSGLAEPSVPGRIDTEQEEKALAELDDWVVEQGLPPGVLSYELSDPATGKIQAILDLAWPHGLQHHLSQPVAVLLNEGPQTRAVANARGFRYFSDVESFRSYVSAEILSVHLSPSDALRG